MNRIQPTNFDFYWFLSLYRCCPKVNFLPSSFGFELGGDVLTSHLAENLARCSTMLPHPTQCYSITVSTNATSIDCNEYTYCSFRRYFDFLAKTYTTYFQMAALFITIAYCGLSSHSGDRCSAAIIPGKFFSKFLFFRSMILSIKVIRSDTNQTQVTDQSLMIRMNSNHLISISNRIRK